MVTIQHSLPTYTGQAPSSNTRGNKNRQLITQSLFWGSLSSLSCSQPFLFPTTTHLRETAVAGGLNHFRIFKWDKSFAVGRK